MLSVVQPSVQRPGAVRLKAPRNVAGVGPVLTPPPTQLRMFGGFGLIFDGRRLATSFPAASPVGSKVSSSCARLVKADPGTQLAPPGSVMRGSLSPQASAASSCAGSAAPSSKVEASTCAVQTLPGPTMLSG